jgi:hypothetical protein
MKAQVLKEITIAAQIGVAQQAMRSWLSGKVKSRLESVSRVRAFLKRRLVSRVDYSDNSN